MKVIDELNERTGCSITILGYGGLIGLMKFIKEHFYNLILIIVIFAIYYYMSTLILDIRISGNSYYTDEYIHKLAYEFYSNGSVLNENDLNEYNEFLMKKADISCALLEKYILSKTENIKWISASIKGNVLYINIREDFSSENDEEEYSEIRSSVYGTIVSLYLRDGTAVKIVGDEVIPGEVVVSGEITVKNNYDEKVATRNVVPDADVCIEFSDLVTYSGTYEVTTKIYTENEKNGVELSFKNNKVFSYIPSNSYKNCDIISSNCAISILDLFTLPLNLRQITYREYNYYTQVLSKDELKAKLMEKAQKGEEQFELLNFEIVSSDYAFCEQEDGLLLNAAYVLRGSAIYKE